LLHYGTHKHRVGADYLKNYEFDNWGRIIRNIDGKAFYRFFKEYMHRDVTVIEMLKENELMFCENRKDDYIVSTSEFKDQIIIYSIILKEKIWNYGGNLAFREWEDSDNLFPQQYHIYNLEKNFQSRKDILWNLIPTVIQQILVESTKISELKNYI